MSSFLSRLRSPADALSWRRSLDDLAAAVGARVEHVAQSARGWPLVSSRLLPTTAPRAAGAVPVAAEPVSTTTELSWRWSASEATLEIVVPPFAVEQVFWTAVEDGWIVGTDLRPFALWRALDWDERGLYALMQLGAVPAPFSMVRGVQRIPNASRAVFRVTAPRPQIASTSSVVDALRRSSTMSPRDLVVDTLDRVVDRLPARAALLFSGGIDSSLVASRLAVRGRTEVDLVNCRFGANDSDARHASVMAASLGLPLKRIDFDAARACAAIAEVGHEYPYPFADYSAIATMLLVRGCHDEAGGYDALVDGAGADAAFGVGARLVLWQRVFAMPAGLRRIGASALGCPTPWTRSGIGDRAWRALERSLEFSMTQAFTVQNTFGGLAYDVPARVRQELSAALERHVEARVGSADMRDRMSFLDMVHLGAGQFAAKTFGPLRRRGMSAVYPFLEPELSSAALSLSWEEKCARGEAKAVLKEILAERVPRDLVVRPKSGFEPPLLDVLGHDDARPLLEACLDPRHNPLLGLCDTSVVERILSDAAHRAPVNYAGRCFVWSHLFVCHWAKMLSRCRR